MDFDRQTVSRVKRFDTPERLLALDNGRLAVITVGGLVFGKGSYGPGWHWSPPAARGGGDPAFDQVGVVLSGRAKVAVPGEEELDLTPGDFFHVTGEYDIRVVGYRPCEVLYLSGVEGLVSRLHRQ